METPSETKQSPSSTTQPPELPKIHQAPQIYGDQPKKRGWVVPVIIVTAVVTVFGAIALIGIIAAIAVPNIGRINEAAIEAKNIRNAQNLASVVASAEAAGKSFYQPGFDLSQMIAAVAEGGVVEGNGPFQGSYFGVPNLTVEDMEGASQFLMLEGSKLIFIQEQRREIAARQPNKLVEPAQKTRSQTETHPRSPIKVSLGNQPKPKAPPLKINKQKPVELETSPKGNSQEINAQRLASIYTGGQAAGADFRAQSVEQAIVELIDGKVISSGAFKGVRFAADDLGLQEIREALPFLKFEDNTLKTKK